MGHMGHYKRGPQYKIVECGRYSHSIHTLFISWLISINSLIVNLVLMVDRFRALIVAIHYGKISL